MKINNIGPSSVNPYKKHLNNNVNESLTSNQKKSDKIEISTKAKEMQEASKLSKERQAKVEDLKIQVQNGTYTPSSKAIAKGLKNFYHNQ
ncbi:negative regulator of flagellin synthesis FlgM [Bacillus pakistanensis]|uniref:Negative regulator of flagellin synthesis n=1 Tax=Rossellomorea pakistanensis TaxID=992288 RepID=A0ABS2NDD6_9BACI|nr:flagellar biosynthesis anti-sigma factor FlgM [Bacillus pakistanensis]MBM7585868.1 negative regulator of flagellin synthesis FlgM [Bacillus pakistanensis]